MKTTQLRNKFEIGNYFIKIERRLEKIKTNQNKHHLFIFFCFNSRTQLKFLGCYKEKAIQQAIVFSHDYNDIVGRFCT